MGLYNNAKGFVVGVMRDEKSIDPFLSINEAVELAYSHPSKLKYDLLIKPFLEFHGPSAIQDVPGVICVPWTLVRQKYNGRVLKVEGPKIFPANGFTQHQSQGSTLERSVAAIDSRCKKYGMSIALIEQCFNFPNTEIKKFCNYRRNFEGNHISMSRNFQNSRRRVRETKIAF